MRLPTKRVSTLVAVALALEAVSLPGGRSAARADTAPRQPASLTRSEYEACQSRDEQSFRTTIESITNASLKRSLSTFDYPAAVADAWRTNGLDDVIDKRVDAAVSEIGNERSWGELLQSLADGKKAQELATAVAERVYRSDAVKTAIEAVASDVGRNLGRSLELATQDAAEPAMRCLEAFLGPRYGTTVAGAVTSDVEKEFGLDGTGRASVSSGTVLSQSSGGLTGAAILLVRRQLANMAARVGQRLVGSVLSRLVSVAAGGVGAVLIAKDIWELRAGVLPIIATEMKSRPTKDLIRAELAKSISDQIGEQLKELSAKSAGRLVEIWQEFRRAHAKSLDLGEREPAFRQFLDRTAAAKLPRLDEVVGLILSSEPGAAGEVAVLRRLADGSLNTAVNRLPPYAMTIGRETRSLEAALKWNDVAGDLLPKVIDYELHRRASPDEYSKVSLARLLALDDKLAISRLAGQPRAVRETLFDLERSSLVALARGLSEPELATLSSYLTSLPQAPRERILRTIAQTPTKMRTLAAHRVRDAVLASSDQGAAIEMMLREGPGNPAQIADDFKAVYEGRISPWLMLDRHPVVLAAALFGLLVALLLLRRVFSRPRRTPPPATVG